jgi:GNAT superfamily N-acetyltransferase
MVAMEWWRDEYSINDDPQRMDIDVVCAMLDQSYWAADRPHERTVQALANSICFNLYHRDLQVGFARVVTDQATFTWVADVIIQPEHRGRGLGKWLMACLLSHPAVQGTRLLLKTRDAHGLYEQFGFQIEECMVRRP